VVAVAALAGCGGGDSARNHVPKLARADASRLASLADRIEARVARGDCGARTTMARLQAEALRLVRVGRVPSRLQEPFLSGVNDLTTRRVPCGRRARGLVHVFVRTDDEIAPVPHSASTAQQARNLAAWLRAYAG
jgi:hypothetical protein